MSLVFSKKNLMENPIEYCSSANIKLLTIFIRKANSRYEEGDPIIPDSTYDIMYEILKKRDPENNIFKTVGYIDKHDKKKVKLPYYMGSMDKIKDLNGILNWCKKYKGPYVVSEKLDGASAILEKKHGILKLYSRGDGNIGKDISHLLDYLTIPDTNIDYCVRGELIVSKENFKKFPVFTTARSMVNGLINKKSMGDIEGLEFVVFELLRYNKIGYLNELCIGQQLDILKELKFNVCMNNRYTLKELTECDGTIEGSNILKILLSYRLESRYDIDGIIITDNKIYEKPLGRNPTYSFAFKSNGIGKITKVKRVEWNVSKHGYLIPRIQIEPISIDGSFINYTTGFNAKFIKENSIGKGSEVRVVRSGDVIPYIIEITGKSLKPDLPETPYEWISSGVNIKEIEVTKEQSYKKITSFFRTLGIDNISDGIIKKLVDSGLDTIKKILLVEKEELVKIDGIQTTLSIKLYSSIHRIIDTPIELSKLMVASLVFGRGFGLKKMNRIIDKYPDILDMTISMGMIKEIEGFSTKTSEQFIDNLDRFRGFIKELDFIKIRPPSKKGDMYSGKKIVLTGFRDNKIIDYIEDNGGSIVSSISKNTDLLIIKDKGSRSSKVDAAEMLGIKILTRDDFLGLII